MSGPLAFVRGTNNGHFEPVVAGSPTAVDDNFLAVLSLQGSVWRISRLIWVKKAKA